MTERDPFLKDNGIPFSAVKLPQLFKQWVEPGKLAEIYAGARHHKASDVMTTNLIYVNSEEDVGHVAWKMARYDVKRVPVIDNGVLVGIITRADIVGLLARDQGCIDDEAQRHGRFVAGKKEHDENEVLAH